MSVTLHKETEATIRKWAKTHGIEAPEAADRLVNTAISRKAALAKYAAKQAKGLKPSKGKKGGKAKGKKAAKSKAKKAA